jgi:hypothetical protein
METIAIDPTPLHHVWGRIADAPINPGTIRRRIDVKSIVTFAEVIGIVTPCIVAQ